MSDRAGLTLAEAERLMDQVAALALPQLRADHPAAAAHSGLRLAQRADDPYVAAARARGSSFTWVAFSFAGYAMWEVHVGCVLDLPQGTAQVGFHALQPRWPDLPQAAITAACAPLGAAPVVAPRAFEVQHNAPPVSLGDQAAAVAQLSALVVRFYRAVAPLLPAG
ncbi:MAG: hypothetical protein HYU88_08675 [Chloroflexi bacterium]|nr:hypothetical protein [Chloroflexota bacterium]MBI4507448.1 hypothetical protein [Chloroflexota bacterium]